MALLVLSQSQEPRNPVPHFFAPPPLHPSHICSFCNSVYNLRYTFCTMHYTLYTRNQTLKTRHQTLDTIQYTLYGIQCTLYNIHYTLYTLTIIYNPASARFPSILGTSLEPGVSEYVSESISYSQRYIRLNGRNK